MADRGSLAGAPSEDSQKVLHAMVERFESYAIIAGTAQCLSKYARLPCMKKVSAQKRS